MDDLIPVTFFTFLAVSCFFCFFFHYFISFGKVRCFRPVIILLPKLCSFSTVMVSELFKKTFS